MALFTYSLPSPLARRALGVLVVCALALGVLAGLVCWPLALVWLIS